MAATRRLPKHLHNVLGPDAEGEFVTILDEIRAEIRADSQEFRRVLDARFAAIDRRFDAIDRRFDTVDKRFEQVDARFIALTDKVADVKSDLMKWSFVFWCGAVLAIAALAGVLRQ